MTKNLLNLNIDYKRPIRIAEDIFWVGFYDTQESLQCNPFVIIDNNEAVVIDGGSRPDFPNVLMKIMQAGVNPSKIKALIYHHFDPDLVGSVSNFEDVIASKELKIISDKANHMFIRHYNVESTLVSLEEIDFSYKFSSGRELKFYLTPYCHCEGSFITLDTKTNVLFASDLFGNFNSQWEIFFDLTDNCKSCSDRNNCIEKRLLCPVAGIIDFHKQVMTSNKALRHSLNIIREIPFRIIAPQHGGVILNREDGLFLCDILESLEDIGIDGIL